MREVHDCDFCGERAAGTFEVVSPERDPTGEGRRMVLCSGCRDTLGTVLEPLLGASGEPGRGSGEVVVAEPERESGGASVSGKPGPGSGTDVDGVPSASAGGAEPDDAGNAGTADTTLGEALGSEGDGGTTAAGGEGIEETEARPKSARRGTPRGYRKVMRFLENREFPLEREEAETLAAEAYGVDRETVSAVIDHAIKHNRLREASGELFQ